jgi:RimJ/RimL family protein N-acetyltransferase
MLSDIDLLRIEIETLYATDERGRLLESREPEPGSAPHLVVAVARDGWTSAIGRAVPDRVASDLEAAMRRDPPRGEPAQRPECMERCEELLRSAMGETSVAAGPSYLMAGEVSPTSAATILRSDCDGAAAKVQLQPPAASGWRLDEWTALIGGELGPWAMGAIDGGVVSICHCARLTDRAAEAGVWTAPGHRGQGHAAAATAAWTSIMRPGGRLLFYSTSADNRSSQRVAARLGLRPIGWLWQAGGTDG